MPDRHTVNVTRVPTLDMAMRTTCCFCAILIASSCAAGADGEPAANSAWHIAPYVACAFPSDYDTEWGLGLEVGRQLSVSSDIALDVAHIGVSSHVLDGEDLQLTPVLVKYRRFASFTDRWQGSAAIAAGAVFERIEYEPLLQPESHRIDTDTVGAFGGEVGMVYRAADHLHLQVTGTLLALTSSRLFDGVLPQLKAGIIWRF